MKKSKVTKVTRFDQVDSYGNSSFSIEFENGDRGFFSTKNKEQSKFIVGSESEYEITEKEGKSGKKYFKISLPQAEWKGNTGRPQVEPKIQFVGFAMRYVTDLIIAGKVEMKELPATFEIVYGEMISKI